MKKWRERDTKIYGTDSQTLLVRKFCAVCKDKIGFHHWPMLIYTLVSWRWAPALRLILSVVYECVALATLSGFNQLIKIYIERETGWAISEWELRRIHIGTPAVKRSLHWIFSISQVRFGMLRSTTINHTYIHIYICLKRLLTSSYIIAISQNESDVVESILMLKLNIAIAFISSSR